ncbi:hypothetical protein VPNG_07175 [Cytospora leucostoma]|uniref:Uncharacterized protein n=1 Tax=Cytospora leucostoma TaxID=1230097 RepID=A0A423WJM7_9PEZI|nr:hypothetical protein VPNG_07175 [Cytospora leucostoma]
MPSNEAASSSLRATTSKSSEYNRDIINCYTTQAHTERSDPYDIEQLDVKSEWNDTEHDHICEA